MSRSPFVRMAFDAFGNALKLLATPAEIALSSDHNGLGYPIAPLLRFARKREFLTLPNRLHISPAESIGDRRCRTRPHVYRVMAGCFLKVDSIGFPK